MISAAVPHGVDWQQFYDSLAFVIKSKGMHLPAGTVSDGPRALKTTAWSADAAVVKGTIESSAELRAVSPGPADYTPDCYRTLFLRVWNIHSNSPAALSGLRRGDLIANIDGRTVAQMSFSEAVAWARASSKSVERLTIQRGTNLIAVNVVRQVNRMEGSADFFGEHND